MFVVFVADVMSPQGEKEMKEGGREGEEEEWRDIGEVKRTPEQYITLIIIITQYPKLSCTYYVFPHTFVTQI